MTPPAATRDAVAAPTLIDAYLPIFDVVERHAIDVRALPAQVYAALFTTDFGDSGILRALLALRALPSMLRRGASAAGAEPRRPLTLASLERSGFVRLAEAPGSELLLGLEGRFWSLDGGRCGVSRDSWLSTAPAAGVARAVWNFTLRDLGDGATRLETETRVLCADAAARRRFLPYWALIRPGSGLIRRAMLRRLRDAAEKSAQSSTEVAAVTESLTR